jgi:hypothetical protein
MCMTLTLILASTGAIAFMITFLVELTRDARQFDEHRIVEFASRTSEPTFAGEAQRAKDKALRVNEQDAEAESCVDCAA